MQCLLPTTDRSISLTLPNKSNTNTSYNFFGLLLQNNYNHLDFPTKNKRTVINVHTKIFTRVNNNIRMNSLISISSPNFQHPLRTKRLSIHVPTLKERLQFSH